ncbi:MAG TPA: tetratricopeptide repeat protein [Candidatus Binataceae bacterium]|jgi:regulator of sirC expression with transglutaminase-like and TPR domain|nr:tetratricopeptide repeat protein [Candidatus Binataceae bacterium]
MPDIADIRRDFATLAAREPIPLARGAFLIAQEEYRDLDIDKYLDKIAALAREAELVVRVGNDTIEKIQLLSHFLFEQKGFDGNSDDYSDPRNSFLNEVLDRRLGIPITLSILYIEIGRRLGLNLYGVGFPTHFLVKAVDDRGELIIDPFYDGAILTLEEIRARLTQIYGQPVEVSPAHLKPVGTRQILVRVLRNLKAVYMQKADSNRALAALDRILLLDPRSLEELMERGALYESLECFKAALDDFQSFLSQAPEHTASETAREAVLRLSRQVDRIN